MAFTAEREFKVDEGGFVLASKMLGGFWNQLHADEPTTFSVMGYTIETLVTWEDGGNTLVSTCTTHSAEGYIAAAWTTTTCAAAGEPFHSRPQAHTRRASAQAHRAHDHRGRRAAGAHHLAGGRVPYVDEPRAACRLVIDRRATTPRRARKRAPLSSSIFASGLGR
jgi:hypothetical protein